MPRAPTTGRPSVVLVVTLLVALAFGAAASLLIGVATSSEHPPVASSEFIVPNSVLVGTVVGALGFLVLFLGVTAFFSQRQLGFSLRGRSLLTVLMMLLVVILFVVAFRASLGGGPSSTGAVPTGVNSTANSTGVVPPHTNLTNGSSVGNFTPFLVPGVPGWVPYALVVGVIVVVVVVAVPQLRLQLEGRGRAQRARVERSREPTEVRQALTVAAGELESGQDAREVIVRLYGRLLSRLRPMVGTVDPQTPEEIRVFHLERLGIRHEAAERLTRLFEEARYSSHPLGPETLVTARSAIDSALADLARTRGT